MASGRRLPESGGIRNADSESSRQGKLVILLLSQHVPDLFRQGVFIQFFTLLSYRYSAQFQLVSDL
jgi:hypothetical protein